MTLELSIIIVSWNVSKLLRDCLTSIYDTKQSLKIEVFVVDNNSSDTTVQMIKDNFPQVILYPQTENLGFAKANNIALKQAAAPLVMLLNPDTKILPNSLKTMVTYINTHSDIAVLGPMLLNKDLQTDASCRRFPSMKTAFHQFTIVKYLKFFKPAYNQYMMKEFDHKSEKSVDQIMGACMLFKQNVIKNVGLLDENFFIFYEEVDYCRRIKQLGFEIRFIPGARIVHISDQSTEQIWDDMLFQKINSLFYYFSKIHSKTQMILFKTIFKIGFILKVIVNVVEYSLKFFLTHNVLPNSPNNRVKYKNYRRQLNQTVSFLKKYSIKIIQL